ncbi:MAG: hypothetical protein K2H74_09445 [Paramuribaculum sp.]|nr:hypothetical protein [Paramuribaculum sp.]
MKKTMSIIALFIVLLISVSANTSVTTKAVVDPKLPKLELIGRDSLTVELDSLLGSYTVIHFWSAEDAPSRIKAIELDRCVASAEGRLNLLSINTDDNIRLFREIVRMDGLDEATQFYAGSAASASLRGCGLGRGLSTILLAPDGTIVEVNPTVENLSQAFGL